MDINSTTELINDNIENIENQAGTERSGSGQPSTGGEIGSPKSEAQPIRSYFVDSSDPDSLENQDQDSVDTQEKIIDMPGKSVIIDEMNKQYAVVMLGGKCRVMREHFDPVFNRPDIIFLGIGDFHNFYSNKKFSGENDKKTMSHSKLWFTSTERRQYEGIVFTPPAREKKIEVPPTYYNLWRGFGVEPKKGDWSLFKDHILNTICNGNQSYFRWQMQWFARIVQDPGGERPGTAIVLMGKRGTGKGTFVNMFQPIFEHHFLQLSNQKHLTGNFNSHLKDKLLVFCDEGFWGGNKGDEGVLKALITEPTVPIEAKGQDLIEIKNHINLMMATNNEWVIPAGLEERRFFVVEVSDRHIQDKQYFRAIWKQMKGGGLQAMLYDLLEWDDPEIDLREAPKTEALLSQIECTMTPLQKWWYQRLTDGENLEGLNEWYPLIYKSSVYNDYMNYTSKMKLGNAFLTDKQFGKRLKKLAPSLTDARETSGPVRRWMYCFSKLEVHRQEFQEILGFSLEWDSTL